MSRKLIVGNWKMNGVRQSANDIVLALKQRIANDNNLRADLAICPPFTLLESVGRRLGGSDVALGAQDCVVVPEGAYTGDVSPIMLKDAGCAYVIVGHSERRQYHQESNALIKQKATAAIKAGLTPIICVGETLIERQSEQTLAVIEKQINACLPDSATSQNCVIAYEPVWAIGTGLNATEAQISDVHAFIRRTLIQLNPSLNKVKVLYGGSVKPSNAKAILSLGSVDGALVGGASLNPSDFFAIAQAVS